MEERAGFDSDPESLHTAARFGIRRTEARTETSVEKLTYMMALFCREVRKRGGRDDVRDIRLP